MPNYGGNRTYDSQMLCQLSYFETEYFFDINV